MKDFKKIEASRLGKIVCWRSEFGIFGSNHYWSLKSRDAGFIPN